MGYSLTGLLWAAVSVCPAKWLTLLLLLQWNHHDRRLVAVHAAFAEELQVGTQVLLRTAPPVRLVDHPREISRRFRLSGSDYTRYPTDDLAGRSSWAVGYRSFGCGIHGPAAHRHAASVAIGTLASSVADNQVVAAILGAAILVSLLLCWLLARITEPPISDLLSHLSFLINIFTAFMEGEIRTPDVAYYFSVTWVCLLITSGVQRMRRWR